MAKSYLNDKNVPRGIRNNNPGNLILTTIKWEGKVPNAKNTDGKFEQFYELRYGIRAMMRNVVNNIRGGKNTVHALMSAYAPASDNNDTASYIATVAQAIGFAPFAVIELSQETLIALVKIIVRVENGAAYAAYLTDSDYQDALAIIGDDMQFKKKALPES